jgi:hypothetical protein
MPSTLVHMALAGLFGAALLGPALDRRAVAALLGLCAFADLDAVLGLVVTGAHRAAFHTLLIPLGAAVLLALDARTDDRLRTRYGDQGVGLAWVGVVVYVFAVIGPDLVWNGVNVLYPVYDQFVAFSGEMRVSNQRGLIQTFVELSPPEPAGGGDGTGGSVGAAVDSVSRGNTSETQYATGVNPSPGEPDQGPVERTFPVARNGLDLLLIVSGTVVTGARLWLNGRDGNQS